MLDLLTENPDKIPQPSKDQMMQMFNDAWGEACDKVGCVDTNKKVLMTLAFDGSENHLANKKLMDLVGKDMLAFREELMKSQPVSTLKELKKIITPPEEVRKGKQSTNLDEPLLDEGMKVCDGDGDDLDMEESNGSDEESDNENPEEQNDQLPTEAEVPVAALSENPVIGNRDF